MIIDILLKKTCLFPKKLQPLLQLPDVYFSTHLSSILYTNLITILMNIIQELCNKSHRIYISQILFDLMIFNTELCYDMMTKYSDLSVTLLAKLTAFNAEHPDTFCKYITEYNRMVSSILMF
jgi:hypothetical protein